MTLTSFIRYPKLRPLDVRPIAQNGQAYFLLRDPLDLSENSLLVPQLLGPVLALCDGTCENARALHAAVTIHYGIQLDLAIIEELLAALDQTLLLENAHAVHRQEQMLAQFRSAPFRPPASAGASYPVQPDDLRAMLDGYLDGAAKSPNGSTKIVHGNNHTVRGMLSPHIDYPRGGPVYAQVWREAEEAVNAADLVVVLGTDHYGNDPFTLTRQNYATPYGVLPTNASVVDALVKAVGAEAAFAGELRHRVEHSLELVAVWLHHIRQGRPVELVPVLCGSYMNFWNEETERVDDPRLACFLDALQAATCGRQVFVVASGDLAHVGPAFGGSALGPSDRQGIRAADDELLAHMCAGDADGFVNAIHRVQNRNNVCGTSPVYLALRTLGAVQGRRVGYDQCTADTDGTSIVSISGVLFG